MPLKDPVARAVYNKQRYKDNREEKLAYQKQYNKDHREEKIIYDKQYRKDHCEERRQYRKDHREESKQYRKDHWKEKIIYDKQYYKDHWEEIKQYHRDNPEIDLRAQKKRFTKLGKLFDLNWKEMKYAIMAWSLTIKKCDDHKCTWCNSTKKLRAHHIWHKAFCPESALDPDNGITLCHDCHMEQHRLDSSFS